MTQDCLERILAVAFRYVDGDDRIRLRRWKAVVPHSLRRVVRDVLRADSLRRAIHKIADRSPSEIPDRRALAELREGWGNEGYSAELDYLEEVARRAAATEGPVLECGSGITTILTALLAGRRGVEVWALEHLPAWKSRVDAVLRQHRITRVNLCLAPLYDYGSFLWYDPPLDRMPKDFRLVVCDGPPSTTFGGRYGLLPVLGARLVNGAVILFDDAAAPSADETLRRWMSEARVSVELRPHESRPFAIVTLC
jgi:hypothetical protein